MFTFFDRFFERDKLAGDLAVANYKMILARKICSMEDGGATPSENIAVLNFKKRLLDLLY